MLWPVSLSLAVAILVIVRLAIVCRATLRDQRHTDPLTRLPNRLGFEAIVADHLKHGHPFSIVWLALDDFRPFNERHDYAGGDLLLTQIGPRIRHCLRPGDACARFGGDQFLILLRGHDATAAMTTRILGNIKATAGVSLYPDDAPGTEELLRLAETALLQAKATHRGQALFYGPSLAGASSRSGEIAGLIRSALANDHFQLVYQPIVNAEGVIVRMEALVRIDDPLLGRVAPVEFIGVAEQTGLIHEVGEWILRKACMQAREWRKSGLPGRVTINLSPLQLASNTRVDSVLSEIAKHRLERAAVTVHITGTMDNTIPLDRLRAAGVRVSSQSNDRLFDEIRVTAPFAVPAHRQELTVLARGIETPEQLDRARAAGCQLFQGYQIAPPLEPDDATQILRTGLFARSDRFVSY